VPRVIASNRIPRVSIASRGIASPPPTSAVVNPLIGGTSFDPATKNALVVLSNANLNINLSAAGAGTWRTARTLSPRTNGKFHFEGTLTSVTGSGSWFIGLVRTAAFNNAQYPGQDVNGIGNSWGGAIDMNSVGVAPGDTLALNDTLEVEVNLDARLYWARRVGQPNWNQTPGANPASGAGGASFGTLAGPFAPAGSLIEQCGLMFNFGTQALRGTVSPGYTRGWPA
jgi:hypothetical protein